MKIHFNAYWYLGLSALSLALMVYVCVKKGAARSLLLFLIVTELAYLVEGQIYINFGSYTYYPKILHNAFYDSHMGALTSNMFTLPVLATFIGTFQLNWGWMLFFVGLMAGVEWLFINLGIYILHWWRIEYTAIGLMVFFPLAKVVYRMILKPLKGFLHSVFLFLCISPLSGTIDFLAFMLFSSRFYHPGWFDNPARDTSSFAIFYYWFVNILLVILIKYPWKRKWLKYILLAIILSIITLILKGIGILESRLWWDQPFYILFPLLMLRLGEGFSHRLAKGDTR